MGSGLDSSSEGGLIHRQGRRQAAKLRLISQLFKCFSIAILFSPTLLLRMSKD